jgi:hypothetical protein
MWMEINTHVVRVGMRDAPVVRREWRQIKDIHAPIISLMEEVMAAHHQQGKRESSQSCGSKPLCEEKRKKEPLLK